MPAGVLFFALDSCDAGVATSLVDDGRMPAFAGLLADGTSMATRAPDGAYISSIWPTIATGLTPEHHQYSCWAVIDPSTYELRETTPEERRGAPVWSVLSESGRQVAVLDAPHFPADPGINGLHLVEWADHIHHFGLHSAPPELADEVVARFGEHEVGSLLLREPRQYSHCDWMHGGPWGRRDLAQTRGLVDDIVAGLARKSDASLHYLSSEDWDLFLTVFSETHCAGHQLWHLHDPEHAEYDGTIASEIGDPLADIYERADAALGRHLAAVDDETIVLVHLTHGIGPFYGATHVLDVVLERLAAGREHGTRGPAHSRAAKWAWQHTPHRTRRLAAPALSRLLRARAAGANPERPVDAAQRMPQPFFAVPNNDGCAAVRLNVVGRESRGVIEREDFLATCTTLATDLSELINIGTGRPAVQRIEVTGGLGVRPVDDVRADLYIEWDRSVPTPGLWSPQVGFVAYEHDHVRSGDHRRDGLLVARGPGVRAGQSLEPVGVEDIAPTIAALLGVALPNADGRPIPAVVGSTLDRAVR